MCPEAKVMAANETREELASKALRWEQRAREAEAERDALAASLTDIRLAASMVAPGFAKEIERRTADPAHSLARRDAEKQAEVLQHLERKVADYRDPSYPVVPLAEVQRLIAEKRHQAEEDEP